MNNIISAFYEIKKIIQQVDEELTDLKSTADVKSIINNNLEKEIEIIYNGGDARKIIPIKWKNDSLIYATCLRDNHIKCFYVDKMILA